MPRSVRLYLADIQRSIERIRAILLLLDKTAFRSNAIEIDGILFNLMTIGEAAKNIPQDIRDLMPEIDWVGIGRFRDFVVHHYFGLDLNKIEQIVQTDIPELSRQLEHLIPLIEDSDDGQG